MKIKIRISLYKHHIAKGCIKNGENCPVARAVTDSLDESFDGFKVHVGYTCITLYKEDNAYVANVPDKIRDSIKQYDKIGIMNPMEFDLKFKKLPLPKDIILC